MQFGKVIFMSTENYDLAICDDEVYWQKEILKYCKTIEKKKDKDNKKKTQKKKKKKKTKKKRKRKR